MRLAVTAKGPHPDSPVDECLGRAYWLLIYDLQSSSWKAIDNSVNRNARKGAGKATAELLLDLGARIVISGEAGPKAFRFLKRGGARLFFCESGSARTAIRAWRDGLLAEAIMPNEIGNPYCLMGHSSHVERNLDITAPDRRRQNWDFEKNCND